MATDTLGYPLDATGVSPNNKVSGELHAVDGSGNRRYLSTVWGAFFFAGHTVVDAANGTPLTYGVQYHVAGRYDVPSSRFQKTVAGIFVIKDPAIKNVYLNYQAVGGDFGETADIYTSMLGRRGKAGRNTDWGEYLDPVELLSDEDLEYYKGLTSGPQHLAMAINRLAAARIENDPGFMDKIRQYVSTSATQIAGDAANSVQAQITAHIADPTVHPQYARIADINTAVPMVKQPSNVSPADGAVNVSRTTFTFTGSAFYGLYEVQQNAAQFQVAKDANFQNIVFDNVYLGVGVTANFGGQLDIGTRYYWRCRYRNIETNWSNWSLPTSFTTVTTGIATPVMTSPANNSQNLDQSFTLTTNAFGIIGTTDTHVSTDWQITTGPNGTGDVVWSSLNDTVNKTAITVPSGKLKTSTTYHARARQNSANNGSSNWTNDLVFITAAVFIPAVIGQSYLGGFYGGRVTIGLNTYAIIVAPKASGESSLALSQSDYAVGSLSTSDSVANTSTLLAKGSNAATWVRALNIGGYSDWQIPASDVMHTLWANLAPAGAATPAPYAAGGAEAFSGGRPVVPYWTSTAFDTTDSNGITTYSAFVQAMDAAGAQQQQTRISILPFRAVRLVDVTTIAANSVPTLGSSYNGGFFAGRIMEGGVLYDLVVAPVSGGETSLAFDTQSTPGAIVNSVYNGASNTAALTTATYVASAFAKAATIGGFNDWYVPSMQELEVIYRNLKPSTTANSTGTRSPVAPETGTPVMGTNEYVRPVGSCYTATVPAQTIAAAFASGGAQALSVAKYWSSTYLGATLMYQDFTNGTQAALAPSTVNKIRLVRKVKVVNPPAEVPTGITGSAFAGGYYAGQFNDGFCNYALVLAPKATGEFNDAINQVTNVTKAVSFIDGCGNTQILGTSSPAVTKVQSLSIGGYADWYIPSFFEMEIVYRNLKPTSAANTDQAQTTVDGTGSSAGTNKYSIPSGGPYTDVNPAQTTVVPFQDTGSEALSGYYQTSTYGWNDVNAGNLMWLKTMSGNSASWNTTPGAAWAQPVTSGIRKRAVRRVALDTPITEAAIASVPTVPGTPWAGGSYAGRMVVNGVLYALVVAPRGVGETSLPWKTNNTAEVGAYGDLVDGFKNTNQYLDSSHPAAVWARGLNISGCTDWYLPARDELEIVYRYLKPDTTANYTTIDRVDAKTASSTTTNAHGTNDNSVPAGTRYLSNTPTATSDVRFLANATPPGKECTFSAAQLSSTVNTTDVVSGPAYIWQQQNNGRQLSLAIGTKGLWRAVRRVKINS